MRRQETGGHTDWIQPCWLAGCWDIQQHAHPQHRDYYIHGRPNGYREGRDGRLILVDPVCGNNGNDGRERTCASRHKSRICILRKYRINVKIIEMVIIYWHVSTKPAFIHPLNHPIIINMHLPCSFIKINSSGGMKIFSDIRTLTFPSGKWRVAEEGCRPLQKAVGW